LTRRRVATVAGAVIVLTLGAVVRNQVKVHRGRLARAEAMQRRHPVIPLPPEVVSARQALFAMLQPVTIANCELERFGERNDGGYLMCGNLLEQVQAGYSYGISGYDDWGCEISKEADVEVHQYDCFNTERPWCVLGDTTFHEECVADAPAIIGGRRFDTVASQFARNGDTGKRVVFKIDIEGAEWDTILAMPDATLRQIDQMAVEFHWDEDPRLGWAHDARYLRAVARLREFFEVGHIHYNNASCVGDLAPFPSFAYEVLFVSKRLAVVDPGRPAIGVHQEDAKNNWALADCQAVGRPARAN
jgi:hypothetical protein